MAKRTISLLLLMLPGVCQRAAADGQAGSAPSLLALARQVAGQKAKSPVADLPFPGHTFEGYGGALVVPDAYLVNPGPPGTIIGKPAASVSFLVLGNKNLLSFAATETLFRHVELGYALNRIALGSLPEAIRKAGLHINRDEIYLHHFNVRVLLLDENSFDLPLPALVIGTHFVYNATIQDLDEQTNHMIRSVGLDKANGVEWTVTLGKTFPKLAFGRPLIVNGGTRTTSAANAGMTGFASRYGTTVEADVACLVTNRLAVGYEFRQNNNPYDVAPGILEDQDDWHAVRVAYAANNHLVLAAAWAYLGPVANGQVACAWGFQIKYDF